MQSRAENPADWENLQNELEKLAIDEGGIDIKILKIYIYFNEVEGD